MTLVVGFAPEVRAAWLASLTGRELSLGLFDGQEELNDARYKRQPVEFGEPQATDDDVQYIENVNEATFADMGRDQSVDGWAVFDERGDVVGGGRLGKAREIPAQDRIFFEPGDFTLGMP